MKWLGHNPFLVLVLSLVAAYFCAIVFVTVLYYSLPASDAAHGQGLLATFRDPFVRLGAATIATMCGVIGFCMALFCLRGRALFRCGLFVVGLSTLALVMFTPFVAFLAVPLALFVAIFALLFCRTSQSDFFHQHESNRIA